jgi:hypothetical protein
MDKDDLRSCVDRAISSEEEDYGLAVKLYSQAIKAGDGWSNNRLVTLFDNNFNPVYLETFGFLVNKISAVWLHSDQHGWRVVDTRWQENQTALLSLEPISVVSAEDWKIRKVLPLSIPKWGFAIKNPSSLLAQKYKQKFEDKNTGTEHT